MLICPSGVSLTGLEKIHGGDVLELDASWRGGVERSARIVAAAAAGDEAVYGINTGFGKLAAVRIPSGDTELLQRNLVLSHCAGIGQQLPDHVVRLAMSLKILSLARGASGVRWELLVRLADMLERGVLPVVPEKGSVGSSGDLAPLAHIAAVMLGEGRARLGGIEMSAAAALDRVGLRPVVLAAKEGLALLNGTQISTALCLSGLFEAWRLAVSSIVTGALSTDAAMGSSAPFNSEIHELRGHPGQIETAIALRTLLEGSQIRESHRRGDERGQDPYCVRFQPQVLGAALDVLRQAGRSLKTEAGAVTDNPVILADGRILSGGNFHGEPVGFAADMVAMAVAEIGSIAQRRIALLVDPAMSFGLPAFLSPEPGLNSGYMALDIASAALASENKALANPRVVDSTPTSANQEDHVAMSCHAARRLLEMTGNLSSLVGMESLCAVQGIEFRAPLRTSAPLREFVARVRKVVRPLGKDRYLADDLGEIGARVREGMLSPGCAPKLEEER